MQSREVLRALGSVRTFEKNRTVFSQYDTGTEVYIVLKGKFGVYVNSLTGFPIQVADIGAGSFFGEMAAIDGMPRSATIIALEDSTSVVVKKSNFAELLNKAPDIASAIFATLRKRVTDTAQMLQSAGVAVPDIPEAMKTGKFKSAQVSFEMMVLMASKVREMNTLMISAQELPPEICPSGVQDKKVRLLPKEYKPYNITDMQNNKDNLRKARLVCPYCNCAFNSLIPLMSGLVKERETPDGRIVYSNINLLLYSNTVCPYCNYTDTYYEFGKPRNERTTPKYPGNQFANEEEFSGWQNEYNRSLDEAIMSYYLSIHCLERVSGNALRFANVWIRLYWLYCDQGSSELAENAAKQALKYYKKYSAENMKLLPLESRVRLCAVLGELTAALGDREQALEFYGKIAEMGKSVKIDFVKDAKKRAAELKKVNQ